MLRVSFFSRYVIYKFLLHIKKNRKTVVPKIIFNYPVNKIFLINFRNIFQKIFITRFQRRAIVECK